MRVMTLSPAFMTGVLSVGAGIPVLFGVSIDTLLAAVAVTAASTLLVVPGPAGKRQMFGQRGDIGDDSVDVHTEYKKVQSSLEKIRGELQAFSDRSKAEIEQHQSISTATREKVDELLVQQGELQARLQAAEQAIVDVSAGPVPGRAQSLGQMVTAHDDYAPSAERLAGAKGSFSIPVRAAITSTQSDEANGYPVDPQRVPGVIAQPQRRMTIRQLLAPGRTQSNSVEYVRETGFTNAADVVQENPNAAKPESTLTFELDSENVTTIAHWIHATKQILSDNGMMQSYIDGRLRYGLMLKEEQQLLNGSGSGMNIHGIYPQATAYQNPGVSVSSATKLDVLRIAMLQVALAEYDADALVLHPIDWAEIELTKDTQDRYLFANPAQLLGPVLWGRPVVPTQAMPANQFLTGAFQLGAQVWDREDASVNISTEDRDNFVKNMVTILAEERLAMTVYRPESFVSGDFDSNVP